jgi:outer membrane protein OmpA-like peptidoglycan-associated protein
MLLAAGFVAAMPTLAHAQWYVGADAGAVALQDFKAQGSGIADKTKTDWGYALMGEAGYAFGQLRLEGELSYRDTGVSKVAGTKGSGDITALSPMVNVMYDFLPESKWHPFVGAGIGAAYMDAGTVKTAAANVYKGNDWAFAYQGIAGLAYDLDTNWQVKTQYRYFNTTDYNLTASPGGQSLSTDYHSHAIMVGFTYKFGAAPAPAPIPVAAPAPAPAAAPAPVPVKPAQVQKNFIVFFDFDKADITPEAAKIIQQAAAADKATGATRIDLTGHTDKAGSDKYNVALSLKRANAVKAQLARLGIPSNEVVVVGKGKSEPLVPTSDGVREPQNRRVEIVLP